MSTSGNIARKATNKINAGAPSDVKATEEQLIYAKILDKGMKIGLAALIVSFLIYLGGLLTPYIPVENVSQYWGLKSHDYLIAANIDSGWSWISKFTKSDFLNFFPIAFLAGLTIVCYAAIIPTLLKKKDTIYVVIALIEVLVLVGAASGILSGGAH